MHLHFHAEAHKLKLTVLSKIYMHLPKNTSMMIDLLKWARST